MVKLMVLSLLIAGAALASCASVDDFESFMSVHGKQYKSPLEQVLRKEIFKNNKQFIDKFNAEKSAELGFELGVSHLTDLTNEEVAVRRGARVTESVARVLEIRSSVGDVEFLDNLLANVSSADIPDQVDWRTVEGRVSAVKDQGQCGSCWAFSSTGALEGQMALRAADKKITLLSEQNLVDCSAKNYGCDGGLMFDAWADIAEEGGIDDSKSYPYKAEQDECKFDKSKVVFNDKNYVILEMYNEDLLKKTVATFGPVSVLIDATQQSFFHYSSGVYKEEACQSDPRHLDHAVLVVGYGTDKEAGDYWIVKNSWGAGWGEKGYIRMSRNNKNNCGIATGAMIPTF